MWTTRDLDDRLVEPLAAWPWAHHGPEVIERAIRRYRNLDSIDRLFSLAVTFDIVDISNAVRRAGRTRGRPAVEIRAIREAIRSNERIQDLHAMADDLRAQGESAAYHVGSRAQPSCSVL